MKLPNGFGTVYKMQGNRRRPYVAKKTIQGKQKAIGYFETFEDAMACLVAYNRDPALLSPSRTTFSEVYTLWKAKHFPQLRSESARVSTLAKMPTSVVLMPIVQQTSRLNSSILW